MYGKQGEWECVQCSKKYTNYSSYYVHMRNKHKEQTRVRDSSNYKIKYTEQQLNDLQDKIYVFLGELGDTNPQNPDRNDQQSITQDPNRFSGHANYLANFVVRTPYENQIQVLTEIPSVKGKQQWAQTLKNFKEQCETLFKKLSTQREKWQFLDPLDADQDPQDEFSLMDIPKLVKNLGKRQMKLQYPEFSIFVLWLSRVCKAQAWKQIYQLCAYCCCEYYDYLKQITASKTSLNWIEYVKERTVENIDNYNLENAGTAINSANWEKMLQFYYKWVQYFAVLPKRQSVQSVNNITKTTIQ